MGRQHRQGLVEFGSREQKTPKVAIGDGPQESSLGIDQQENRSPRAIHPLQGGPDRIVASHQDVLDGLHDGVSPPWKHRPVGLRFFDNPWIGRQLSVSGESTLDFPSSLAGSKAARVAASQRRPSTCPWACH